jgi:histidyl-tRNA synthetase
LGAQDAVCSGGRYDSLITQLGGDATPAIGFAMGVERAVELMRQTNASLPGQTSDVFVVVQGGVSQALKIAEDLRDALPKYRFDVNLGGGNFKAQFRRADRSGAALAIVIGEDELARGVVALKPLRQETGQSECAIAELPSRIEAALRGAVGGSGRG